MTVTREQIINIIRNHAEHGCDKMGQEACPRLLMEIDTLFVVGDVKSTKEEETK